MAAQVDEEEARMEALHAKFQARFGSAAMREQQHYDNVTPTASSAHAKPLEAAPVVDGDLSATPLSEIERAAGDETLAELGSIFPDWEKESLQAVLAKFDGDLQAASEAIVTMGERSGGQAVTASRVRGGAVGGREDTEGDRALAESLHESEVDLSSAMSRNELDAYERAVMGGAPPSSSAGPNMMPVTITVPPGYSAGQALKVRMVDGSEYNVPVPEGVAPGGRFIAHFPVQDMQEAARGLLGAEGEEEGDVDLQRALQASQEEERRQEVQNKAEEEELAEAMRRSAGGD